MDLVETNQLMFGKYSLTKDERVVPAHPRLITDSFVFDVSPDLDWSMMWNKAMVSCVLRHTDETFPIRVYLPDGLHDGMESEGIHDNIMQELGGDAEKVTKEGWKYHGMLLVPLSNDASSTRPNGASQVNRPNLYPVNELVGVSNDKAKAVGMMCLHVLVKTNSGAGRHDAQVRGHGHPGPQDHAGLHQRPSALDAHRAVPDVLHRGGASPGG
jgi:hypothetical protein